SRGRGQARGGRTRRSRTPRTWRRGRCGDARSADGLARGRRAVALVVVLARVTRVVDPAIARLARRAIVEVDELAGRVDPQAHPARVERRREVVDLLDRHADDVDV